MLRVSAVKGIGGFDEEFPLDYLDHVTFRKLRRRGGHINVLQATLYHALSLNVDGEAKFENPNFLRRYWPYMRAEHRFYRRFATPRQALGHYGRSLRILFWLLYGRKFKRAVDHVKSMVG